MLQSLRHLFAYSWARLIVALGTTTLSIVLFSFVLPVIIFLTKLLVNWRRERKAGKTVNQIVKESFLSWETLIPTIAYALMWTCLLVWAITTTAYADHEALLAKIHQQALDRVALSHKPNDTTPIPTKRPIPKAQSVLPSHQETPTQVVPQPVQQPVPTVNQPGRPLTQLERLAETNRRFSEPDRAHFSEALYDFAGIEDQANVVWGKANNVDTDLNGIDIATRKTRLTGVLLVAKDYEKSFRTARQKWHYFEDQVVYIFGDNPDNDAAVISNAADKYLYFLHTIESIQSKEDKPILDILSDERSQYQTSTGLFARWKRDCDMRLQQMRDSIK